MIIHLNGMPGVGKYTIAKILAEKLPARLIDNHLVLDLVVNVCSRGSPAYLPMIAAITEVVHKTLIEYSGAEDIIFTNSLTDLPEDRLRLEVVEKLSDRMKKAFVPILIECEEDENIIRLTNPSRSGKGKLMDRNDLKSLRLNHKIYHPEVYANGLPLDTTRLTAEESAEKILTHIRSLS